MSQAELGIAALRENVDALLVIPNERLKLISEEKITLLNAFSQADLVLKKGVQSISDLINIPGIINLDFADVVSIMKGAGLAHMGTGSATGKDKAEVAAKMAISSPLLETSIDGAKGVIINITGSVDMSLEEVDRLPRSSMTQPIPMRTSSGVYPAMRTWRTRSTSPSLPPALKRTRRILRSPTTSSRASLPRR